MSVETEADYLNRRAWYFWTQAISSAYTARSFADKGDGGMRIYCLDEAAGHLRMAIDYRRRAKLWGAK